MNAPASTRTEVNGWIVLDKPVGMTSTHAVSRAKRMLNAKKAGHAGTLDPLASGILPIALGEATKTVPYIQDGLKAYRFVVQWGAETNTDDADGSIVSTSEVRPAETALEALLPRFTGVIQQVPPAFSAIKIAGERAYDLAREGEAFELEARAITVETLRLVSSERDRAEFEAECGKGTYVRALARDLGRALGCLGHVTALRRTRVGPFGEADSVSMDQLAKLDASPAAALLPVEAGLTEVPCVVVDRTAATRLRRGGPVLLRGRDAPLGGPAYAACGGVVIAVGAIEHGEFVPHRVFNLPF